MKICLMCDLHLPFDKNALQHNALDWAIEDICKKKADCVLCAGDITCDGNTEMYRDFFLKMAENGIFWEMNVSYDSIHEYREHRYVFDFMMDKKKAEIIKNAGVYISIGFDSHRCEDYDGFKVHQMYDFLKHNSFKTIDEIFCVKGAKNYEKVRKYCLC